MVEVGKNETGGAFVMSTGTEGQFCRAELACSTLGNRALFLFALNF